MAARGELSDSHNDQGMFIDVAEDVVEDVRSSLVVITTSISESPAAITSRLQPAPDYAGAVMNDPRPPPISDVEVRRRHSYLTQFERDNFRAYTCFQAFLSRPSSPPPDRMDSKSILVQYCCR